MKKCTKCGKEKPLSEYHKQKRGRFGVHAACKKCAAAGQKKWSEENKDKKAAGQKKWREENKEKKAASQKKWQEENKEKMTASWHKYQARKAGNGGAFTAREWRDLKKKYGYKCLCCGEKNKLEADHVIPVSKGGTSDIYNIQPLCKSCNSSKGNRHSTDYR